MEQNKMTKNDTNKNKMILSSIHSTVENIYDFKNINLNDILEFTKNKFTTDTAKQYIDIMNELINKIDSLNISDLEKKQSRSLFVLIFSKMCESDCKGIMLNTLSLNNKKYKELFIKLQTAYQQERDEHNLLLKKYNEKEKESIVSIPGITLSLTLKNIKTLNPNECVNLMNEIDLEDEELTERFKRISIPENYKNKLNRVYVKSSDNGNNCLQKPSSKK